MLYLDPTLIKKPVEWLALFRTCWP